ncbi:restriction endonuclease PLD domain-containing protein [Arthrobacter sp. NPDC057259]|uniref:restriction endonuclease PLD domain-containing protein n=1 Tax=Arthrobacter sp. NPDC057259 TaxID=3346073 RepID=UPI00363C6F6A
MFADRLFERVLIEPHLAGADTLTIVTGYASPATLIEHTNRLKVAVGALDATLPKLSIDLRVGMFAGGGTTRPEHDAFVRLTRQSLLDGSLRISYFPGPDVVHSKVYLWSAEGLPASAFTGSANYTNPGFGLQRTVQQNVMTYVYPEQADEYCESGMGLLLDCSDVDESTRQRLPVSHQRPSRMSLTRPTKSLSDPPLSDDEWVGVTHSLSLLNTYGGDYFPGGGINWGLSRGRVSKDEAYISIPSAIGRCGFFPPRNVTFDMIGDDSELLSVRVASGENSYGKDLTTTAPNSHLGSYIRRRMGLPPGAFIGRRELDQYGRSDIDVTYVGDGQYTLDFSVS